MLSYSQNAEDVMLARALADVVNGFYVDVGAWDPFLDSVTAHFYEKGWRGINIEPAPCYFEALQAARPRDVNLAVAVGATAGTAPLYLIENSGLSTLDPAVARRHEPLGLSQEQVEIELTTLNAIFERYAPPDVHFLKIDCEGSETQALGAFDLERHRPWIILVEATEPLSQKPSHGPWEGRLLGSGYSFEYFDGLNRFYIAEEHAALKEAFKVPPNIFDNIEKFRERSIRMALESEIRELRTRLEAAEAEIARCRALLEAANEKSEQTISHEVNIHTEGTLPLRGRRRRRIAEPG